MPIVQTLTESAFIDAFQKVRPDNFSSRGLSLLFEYYESYSYDTGENVEFDPIAICCDWSEYNNIEEIREEYDLTEEDYPEFSDMLDYLEGETTVLYDDDEDPEIIIIQNF